MAKDMMSVFNLNGELENIEVIKYFKFKNDNNKYIIYKSVQDKGSKYRVYAAKVSEDEETIYLENIDDLNFLNNIRKVMEMEIENVGNWGVR